jgi:hypothetical protein
MFTGDTTIQHILHDINAVENGILLEYNVHDAFGDLGWGIDTETENGNCRYFIRPFRCVYFQCPGVGDGTELYFSIKSSHSPPNPDLCRLHLAVCAVAHTCDAAAVFDKLLRHDPDIIDPAFGQYTLPTDPISDPFFISYFERRLFEESIQVPPTLIITS